MPVKQIITEHSNPHDFAGKVVGAAFLQYRMLLLCPKFNDQNNRINKEILAINVLPKLYKTVFLLML